MPKTGGYAGSILKVDLSNRKILTEPIPQQWKLDYIGGTGIGYKLVCDHVRPKEDPLGPGNALVFNAGPMVGTLIPGAGKCTVIAKSPVSWVLGHSGTGHLGMLKFTGYDHLMITGKADRPVYLKIDDDVQICDAVDLWGKDTWEATEALWQKLGKRYVVACIGPAGENLANQANIIVNKYSAFAQSGMGAVMGSKNLKAIVLCGSESISVADPDRFAELVSSVYQEAIDSKREGLMVFRKMGTLLAMGPPMHHTGPNAYKNFREVSPPDMPERFPLDRFIEEIKVGDLACMGCPIGCKHFIRLLKGDRAGETMAVSCLVSGFHGFAGFCGGSGWEGAIRYDELSNRLGLDYLATGAALSFAIDLYREGLIDKSDTEGLELDWGSAEAFHQLLEQIASKQGVGKILAEGLRKAPHLIGKNSENYAVHSRGHAVCYDPRRLMTSDLFSMMVNASGDKYAVPAMWDEEIIKGPKEFMERHFGIPSDKAEKALSNPEKFWPARFAKWGEDVATLYECLGLCKMPPYQKGVELSILADLYASLTGIETDVEKLLKAAGHVWDIRRTFDIREGRTRKDDQFIAKRFITEPLESEEGDLYGPFSQEKFDRWLTEYYDERGWDVTDGSVQKS